MVYYLTLEVVYDFTLSSTHFWLFSITLDNSITGFFILQMSMSVGEVLTAAARMQNVLIQWEASCVPAELDMREMGSIALVSSFILSKIDFLLR